MVLLLELQTLSNDDHQGGVIASALTLAMERYQINTRLRIAAFIAQVGHESGQFRYVRELGGDQYLRKYDTGTLASAWATRRRPMAMDRSTGFQRRSFLM